MMKYWLITIHFDGHPITLAREARYFIDAIGALMEEANTHKITILYHIEIDKASFNKYKQLQDKYFTT
jgi:hypothetical protein